MDKNIAALLREDARTVHVIFDLKVGEFDEIEAPGTSRHYRSATPKVKSHTYVTHLDVAENDTVVVEAAGEIKLALVHHVDSEVKIEPNSNTLYRWVIAKVDMGAHNSNTQRNQDIEQAVADAYRNNLRRSFAQQILSGVDDSHRESLQRLIGASNG